MAVADLLYLLLLLIPLLFLVLTLIVRPKPTIISIKNRHVFISGGSSGIGLALAHQAASQGSQVSILARNPDRLEEAQNAISLATGIEVATFIADVRDYESVKRAIDRAGPIDVLICNQAVFFPEELEKQEVETVKLTMDVNVMGCFHLIKAALPGMKSGKDRGPRSIALVSSGGGLVGTYSYTAYCASKFALRGLAEALQQEVISDNIHISLIFPPETETPGLVEEVKRRPVVTKLIAAGSSEPMKADEVARKAFEGIKSATFMVPCNFEGLLLSIGTAGYSPQRSPLMAFVEVVAGGVLRVMGLFFQRNLYGIIAKSSAQMNGT